jgi:hypothetical protein
MLVLQQIRRFLACEAIGVRVRRWHRLQFNIVGGSAKGKWNDEQ